MIPELFLKDLSLWSCLWQSTLFAVFGLACSFLLRRRPARASQVLFLAIIAAVLLPILSLLVRQYGLGLFTEKPIVLPPFELGIPAVTPEILSLPEIQSTAFEVTTDFPLENSDSEAIRIPWRLITLHAWMIAVLILLGRLLVAFINGIRLLRRARSDRCEHVRLAADSARARLGITTGLKIHSSKNVRSPMIWCWSRPPILLVPADLDNQIDWEEVICHELAHWKRWDHISGFIAELAVCILPWNPLLWWSKKRMVRLSEQACDDWVLAGGCAGTDYAQSLLNLSPELQMAFMPTVIGKEKPMKKRIYRIVKEKCGIPQVGARWALVVTMVAATLTVGVALAQRRPASFEQLERDERIAAERRGQQVLATRRSDLEKQARELRARLDEVRKELAELEESGRAESDQAHALRSELRELEEAMARMERELQELEGQPRQREMRPWPDREPPREILRRLEELSRETEFLLQGLADQRINRNDETNMLYNRLRELNEQMRQVRQQLGRQLQSSDRRRRGLDELDRERDRDRRIQETRRLTTRRIRLVNPEEIVMEGEELKVKAGQIELELDELGGENPERAEKLHAELRAIHEKIAQIERELGSSRVRGAMRDLQEQARQLERRLQELGDNHPDQAHELQIQLDQIHRQMGSIKLESNRPERPWPSDEDPMLPGGELRRARLMVQREQIQAQMRELEHVLQELNEQEKADSEEARLHQRELRDLQELLRDTERQLQDVRRDSSRVREREDLEREVQNLRKQMDGMNEQMGEMRELMRRLLEKSAIPEVE